jgi:hypothetical protein
LSDIALVFKNGRQCYAFSYDFAAFTAKNISKKRKNFKGQMKGVGIQSLLEWCCLYFS